MPRTADLAVSVTGATALAGVAAAAGVSAPRAGKAETQTAKKSGNTASMDLDLPRAKGYSFACAWKFASKRFERRWKLEN